METLAERLDREGNIGELDAVGWAIRLAKRLEQLHGMGVAHGGVSPKCLRVAAVDRASPGLLVDVSQAPQDERYFSPERVETGRVSAVDDTWAVAATLYTALTGSAPFQGASPEDTKRKIRSGAPAPLAAFDVGDDDLQRILDEAFQRDLGKRRRMLRDLRSALEGWHPDKGVASLPPLDMEGGGESERPPPPADDDSIDDEERTVMRDFGAIARAAPAVAAAAAAPRPAPVAAPRAPAPAPSAPRAPAPAPSAPRAPAPAPPRAPAPAPRPAPAPARPPAAAQPPAAFDDDDDDDENARTVLRDNSDLRAALEERAQATGRVPPAAGRPAAPAPAAGRPAIPAAGRPAAPAPAAGRPAFPAPKPVDPGPLAPVLDDDEDDDENVRTVMRSVPDDLEEARKGPRPAAGAPAEAKPAPGLAGILGAAGAIADSAKQLATEGQKSEPKEDTPKEEPKPALAPEAAAPASMGGVSAFAFGVAPRPADASGGYPAASPAGPPVGFMGPPGFTPAAPTPAPAGAAAAVGPTSAAAPASMGSPAPVGAPPTPSPAAALAPPKKSKTGLVVALSVVLLLVVAAGTFLFLRSRGAG